MIAVLRILIVSAMLSSSALAEEPVTLERFNDWYLTCVENGICRVFQRISIAPIANGETKEAKLQDVLSVAIAPLGGNRESLGIIVQTPLNVFLKSGMGIQVDSNKGVELEYRNCDIQGCWVVEKAQRNLINQIKRGKTGYILLQLLNGKKVKISFSLIGFTKAIERLRS